MSWPAANRVRGLVRGMAALLLLLVGGVRTLAQTFDAEIAAFEAAVAREAPPPGLIVVVGSSTITRWTHLASDFPDLQILNRGFGGSQFTDVLHYYPRLIPPLRPALLLIYEGDNDLAGGRSVDQVFADWAELVTRVAADLPETHIWFLSTKPSPSRVAFLPLQRELNQRIAEDCRTRARAHFVDLASAMLDAAGRPRTDLFVGDQLHLNAQGYTLWKSLLAPHLAAWMRAHPERPVRTPQGSVLVDLGDPTQITDSGADPGSPFWNNVTASTGAAVGNRIPNLIAVGGAPSGVSLEILSRFNGANQNGTTSANAPFPATATRDSLFGNTELFSGLANLTPSFRLSGLTPSQPVDLTFYASRLGVSDRRETRYTVTGASTSEHFLDAANNVALSVTATGVLPRADGTLDITLTPGPQNNNANHFTYLGALKIQGDALRGTTLLIDFGAAETPSVSPASSVPLVWNNLTPPAALTTDARLAPLLDTRGTATPLTLELVRPFERSAIEGTPNNRARFPASATLDSLITTASADGAVCAEIRLRGLAPEFTYSLAALAAHTNPPAATAHLTVIGRNSHTLILDPQRQPAEESWLPEVHAAPDGSLLLRLGADPQAPTGATLALGTLRLEWRPRLLPPAPQLSVRRGLQNSMSVFVQTEFSRTCRLETSTDLIHWRPLGTFTPPANGLDVALTSEEHAAFFRLVDAP